MVDIIDPKKKKKDQLGNGASGGTNSAASGNLSGVKKFSDPGIVGIPEFHPIDAISSGITNVRQSLANFNATSAKGGMKPPITNASISDNSLPTFISPATPQRLADIKPIENTVNNITPISPIVNSQVASGGTNSAAPSVLPASVVSRRALADGDTLSGPGFSISQRPGLNPISLNRESLGGNRSTPESLSALGKTIDFNSLQSTKDMFARNAQETADRSALARASVASSQPSEIDRLRGLQEQARNRNDSATFKTLENQINTAQKLAGDLQVANIGSQDESIKNQIAVRNKLGDLAFNNQKEEQNVQSNIIANINKIKETDNNPRNIYSQTKTLLGDRPMTFNLLKQIHTDIPEEATTSKKGLRQFLIDSGYPAEDAINIEDSSGL